jgi:hypothetical protein
MIVPEFYRPGVLHLYFSALRYEGDLSVQLSWPLQKTFPWFQVLYSRVVTEQLMYRQVSVPATENNALP